MAHQISYLSYSDSQLKIAQFAKALSHPARIAIMEFLQEKSSCFCGDIVNVLPISQSSVSQHLKELKEAGLLIAKDLPPKVEYCIDRAQWAMAKEYFCHLFEKVA